MRADVAPTGSSNAQCLFSVRLCYWLADLSQFLYIKIAAKVKICDLI